jgi:hypothetical protein
VLYFTLGCSYFGQFKIEEFVMLKSNLTLAVLSTAIAACNTAIPTIAESNRPVVTIADGRKVTITTTDDRRPGQLLTCVGYSGGQLVVFDDVMGAKAIGYKTAIPGVVLAGECSHFTIGVVLNANLEDVAKPTDRITNQQLIDGIKALRKSLAKTDLNLWVREANHLNF